MLFASFEYHYQLMAFHRITFLFLSVFCVFLFFSAGLSSLDSGSPFKLNPLLPLLWAYCLSLSLEMESAAFQRILVLGGGFSGE